MVILRFRLLRKSIVTHRREPYKWNCQELSDWLLMTSFKRCYWLPLNGSIVMRMMTQQSQVPGCGVRSTLSL